MTAAVAAALIVLALLDGAFAGFAPPSDGPG